MRRPPRQKPADGRGAGGDRFHQLLAEGTRALQQGRYAEAILLLEMAHGLDPEHQDAALNLGGAYILTKKFKQAIAILEPLSQRRPDEPMIWTNLGAAYLGNPILAKDEDQQQAIGAFKLALALNPKTPHVAYNLGLIYRDRQETEEALYWFRQAVEADPNDRDARAYIKQLTQPPAEGELGTPPEGDPPENGPSEGANEPG